VIHIVDIRAHEVDNFCAHKTVDIYCVMGYYHNRNWQGAEMSYEMMGWAFTAIAAWVFVAFAVSQSQPMTSMVTVGIF